MKILKGSKIHDTTTLVCDIIGKLLSNVVGHYKTAARCFEKPKLSIGFHFLQIFQRRIIFST
jgi:hypothetical protein